MYPIALGILKNVVAIITIAVIIAVVTKLQVISLYQHGWCSCLVLGFNHTLHSVIYNYFIEMLFLLSIVVVHSFDKYYNNNSAIIKYTIYVNF